MGESTIGASESDPTVETDNDPLDLIESRLVTNWIKPTVGDIAVEFGPVEARPLLEGTAGVHLTFLGITPAAPPRSMTRQPPSLLMLARYLVTASAPAQAQADRLIVALGFAALDRRSPELERDGPAPDLWLALGVIARPALLIRAVLERRRVIRQAPLVRQPAIVEYAPRRKVAGRVVGPGEVPITGARIEVLSAGLTAYSDHRGEFTLTGVPLGPPAPTLVVTAKGVRLTLPAEPGSTEQLVISVPLPEL
jgi:hypothetical protein